MGVLAGSVVVVAVIVVAEDIVPAGVAVLEVVDQAGLVVAM